MKANTKQDATRPFFARLLEGTCDKQGAETQGKGGEPVRTTRKAGKGGNDIDHDQDTFQRPNVPPPMTTMKAGKCGNDCDNDSDGQ
jgi:hypothetical protein